MKLEWLNCVFYLQNEGPRAQQAGTLSWHIKFGDHPAFLSQFQPFPALKRIILQFYAKGISAGGIWVWPYPPTLLFSGLYKNIFNWLCWVDRGQFFHSGTQLSQGSTQTWEQLRKMDILEWYWIKEDSTQCFQYIAPQHLCSSDLSLYLNCKVTRKAVRAGLHPDSKLPEDKEKGNVIPVSFHQTSKNERRCNSTKSVRYFCLPAY